MEVPAGEPEVHGDYFVWVDNGKENTFGEREQVVCIAKSSSQLDNFGRCYAVCFIPASNEPSAALARA